MLNEIIIYLSKFWLILSLSFLVALTGAMAPGPLLTYTIIKSVKTNSRGYLMGVWIIIGHAIVEMGIIIFLLLGFSFILKNTIMVRSIGVAGGIILIYFGGTIIKDVKSGNIPSNFLNLSRKNNPLESEDKPGMKHDSLDTASHESAQFERKILDNPVAGGIVVSMSNPYWWIWWATIGFAFMVQFDVTFKQWPNLLAFFIGHEAGDLVWYLFVSALSFFGMQYLNKRTYYGILVFCGIFMIIFGVYLGISPFLNDANVL